MRARNAGEPCWFNILTPAPDEARAFFQTLLGWTFTDLGGMGHYVIAGEHPVGAIFDVVSPQTPDGTDPILGLSIKIADADDTAARVRAAGGRARNPFDIDPAGRLAVCHDVTGAEFDAWQARAMKGWDHDARALGAPVWFELRAPDVAAAAAFYAAALDWRHVHEDSDGRDGAFRLGRRTIASVKKGPPRWVTFLAVDDVTVAARLARKLGAHVDRARVVRGKRAVDVESPHGVAFSLVERA